jgi:hypothetical protein
LQKQFEFSSSYWTNNETYAVEDGLEGLTEKQTKLASYWNTPFKKLCLGMKVKNVTKWIEVDHQASSLFDVIADGVFKRTWVGKNKWKSLIDHSLLQEKCNKEGFNFQRNFNHRNNGKLYMKIRIGLPANNENDCKTPDSCIGFGISTRLCFGRIGSTTCGGIMFDCWVSDKNVTAFGFILVK